MLILLFGCPKEILHYKSPERSNDDPEIIEPDTRLWALDRLRRMGVTLK